MFADWFLLLVSLTYLGLLFTIAYYGDRKAHFWRGGTKEPVVYALSLAIYCTSWTFYGSVGRAATSGMDFLLIYVGPILVMVAGYPVLQRILAVARAQNITSVADFIGARYGKSRLVAASATVIAFVGVMPYIALQLQAASLSFDTLVLHSAEASDVGGFGSIWRDSAVYIAITMAVFSILFGVRHIQASERHHGMIFAIAFESLVKLSALLAVGLFVVFGLFNGIGDWAVQVVSDPAIRAKLDFTALGPSWGAIAIVSALAFICLPRQFHVAVVESGTPKNLGTAVWLFPLYLFAINIFVPVLAAAGLLRLSDNTIPDLFVLKLPLEAGRSFLSLAVFIGGLSAATSMVIVESVALSAMISNELVMPLLLRQSAFAPIGRDGIGKSLLAVRRATILVIFFVAYAYYRAINGRYPLASIGLISFAAVAQFGPALLIGLFWRGAHRHGAMAGMVGGILIWAYTLLLPSFEQAGWILPTGPLGGALPQMMTVFDPFTNGVLWSLLANTALLVGVSLFVRHRERDQIQAEAFVTGRGGIDPFRAPAPEHAPSYEDLKNLVSRLLGVQRAEQAFSGPIASYRDRDLADFTERLLSGAIGAASARIMVASVTQRRGASMKARRTILVDASQAILFNRDLLRATLENVGQGIGMFDVNCCLAAWNQRFLLLLGIPDGLARIGTPLAAIVEHLSAAPVRVDLAVLLPRPDDAAPFPRASTHEVRRSDGLVLELQTNPIPDGGFVLACSDITDRIRTLEALRDSERRIRVYTDNVPVLIAYVDREERYRFTNRSYEQALGLARDRATQLTTREALGEERYSRLKPYIDAALAGHHQTFEIEFPGIGIELARGTYIPHFDETGRVAGFFTLYQDITDQRRAEQVLREANEMLERRVEERTRELTHLNQELEQAKTAADLANQSKTRFLAAASHDLLQPLHASRLFAATLLEQRGAEDRLLDQLDESLGAVEQILQALLEISKLDAGALTANPRPVSIGDIMRSVAGSFEPMAGDRNLRLRVVDSRAVVMTDPMLLRRILQNFVSNAIRYTRRGGVLIGCRHRGDKLVVEVWDTGRGIPPDKLGEIFGEFRRLYVDDPETPGGLGLGLAIVDRIAAMLGHPVTVRSWPGQGTVFSIALPVAPGLVQARPTPRRTGIPNALRGKAVLCVDNDHSILVAMRSLLEAWSCIVFTASDLATAQAAMADAGRLPDVVLLDYHLANGESGLELLDTLSEHAGRRLRAILITADYTEAVRAVAQARDFPLINKPVNPAALRALLSRMVMQSDEALSDEALSEVG